MNIVIADDEQIILKWMKKNIEELSPHYHVTGIYSNGKQVLDWCLKEKVDVLFTDIRMPVMDGMELLKALGENQPIPYTIILSAYDDFSYARECFKLGVKEFLLKSEITREELEKCLRTAREYLRNPGEKKEESSSEQMEDMLRQELSSKGAAPDRLAQYWNTFSRIKSPFVLTLLDIGGEVSHMEHLEEITAFFFQEEKLSYYFVPQGRKRILVISELGGNSPSVLAEKLFKGLGSFGYKDLWVSGSTAGEKGEDLSGMYQEAEAVSLYQNFYFHREGLSYDKMVRQQENIPSRLKIMFGELQNMIGTAGQKEIEERIRQIFQFVRRAMPEAGLLRKTILNFVLNIYWNYLEGEQRREISADNLLILGECADVGLLEEEFSQQMNSLLLSFAGKKQVYSQAVQKIMEYIEANYRENISLEELAVYVHMNRSYVSHLFKKETGDNLYNYLQQYRLEKAKELLEHTRDSIQEICWKVGIQDSGYFSKVFKKYAGMTPLEYRKSKQ